MFDPLQIPNVWRADSLGVARGTVVPSGFSAIDSALGGGWPCPALIEIFTDVYGIGELQLFLPLFRALSNRSSNRALMLWLNPPHQPNSVALAQVGLKDVRHWVESSLTPRDTLWAMEQTLRLGACSVVVAWAGGVKSSSLRRLKLAVAASPSVALLYRPLKEAEEPSPATIRLRLAPSEGQLSVSLFKIPGRRSCDLTLDIERHQLQQGWG